jgi:HD domain
MHQMLSALPYPRKLCNVPLHAASHHERMDGKRYPFGLDRRRLSMQGRIIAIADVFETLTAGDRPYKPGKPLSEALDILRDMKENGHIDPDLYDLFTREKIYLRYGRECFDPSQSKRLRSTRLLLSRQDSEDTGGEAAAVLRLWKSHYSQRAGLGHTLETVQELYLEAVVLKNIFFKREFVLAGRNSRIRVGGFVSRRPDLLRLI